MIQMVCMRKSGLCDVNSLGPTLQKKYLSERRLYLKLGHWTLSVSTVTYQAWDNLKSLTILSFIFVIYKLRILE